MTSNLVVVYPLVASLVCNSFFIENSTYSAACSHNQRDLYWPGCFTRRRHELIMRQCNRTNSTFYVLIDTESADILFRPCLVSHKQIFIYPIESLDTCMEH